MKVLIACEESQVVTNAFRNLGHETWSCDVLSTSGPHPEWHIEGDVIPLLSDNWDMIVAFPPCTNLSCSGARWFKEKQEDGRQQKSIEFFMKFAEADCPRIAIENPVGIMSTRYRKPDQIIQPWQFGHPESKRTCLWLKGLPRLQPTDILPLPESGRWSNQTPSGQNKLSPSEDRSKLRSKTYQGIAKAMANQWG
tara:strand:- start:1083 stop:1667 length:585 start_codon:yes stop_codon:yes gene_type:complete